MKQIALLRPRSTSLVGVAAAALTLLTGCVTMERQEGAGIGSVLAAIKRGDSVEVTKTPAAGPAAGGAGAAATAPQANANPLRGTELDGLFKKHPISNSNKPERWPRVAITIKSASAGVLALPRSQPLTDNDCIVFDARLWKSATDSQRFDNLRLCTPGVEQLSKGAAFRTLNLFPRYTVPRGENSTAAQRTDGPVQPFYMFPQDIRSAHAWTQTFTSGIFYLGALMLALGYDWDNDFDRRLWVVNVPLPST